MKIRNCNNVQEKYIIFREVDGENWYYGSDDDLVNCSRIVAELSILGANVRIVETENVICSIF